MIKKNLEFSGQNIEFVDKNAEFLSLLEIIKQHEHKIVDERELTLAQCYLTRIVERAETCGPQTKRFFKDIIGSCDSLLHMHLALLYYADTIDFEK